MDRRKIWKTVLYVCAFLILVVGLIFSGLQLLESTVYSEQPEIESEWESRTITVDGVDYFPRQDITVVMALGIDEEGPVQSSNSYRNHGEADAVMLVILDHKDDRVDVLCLNRDTMVQMPVLGIDGRVSGTTQGQLALSHTFGKGLEDSCENTLNTVSELLNGIVIDHYFAMNMDGIAIVNDAVGGVTVNVMDDFSNVDRTLKKGEVTLSGAQALTFVQTRKNVGDQLNLSRMNRHKEYMNGLLKAVNAKIAEDDTFSVQLYEQISEYTVTDCSVNVISGMMNRCVDYTLGDIITPDGENVLSETYYEFYVDREALDKLILRLFYDPK